MYSNLNYKLTVISTVLSILPFITFAQPTSVDYLQKGLKLIPNKCEKAIQYFNIAIDKSPQLGKAYIARGTCETSIGKYKEALRDLNFAISLNQEMKGEAYFRRALLRSKTGKLKMAIKDYSKALEFAADYGWKHYAGSVYYNRGAAKYKLGKHQSACADWKRSVKQGYKFSQKMVQMYCKQTN